MHFREFVWLSLMPIATAIVPGCTPQKKCICICPIQAQPPRHRERKAGSANYIAMLLMDKPFVAYKTKRIHLYYYKSSEAEKDRDLIVRKRERALDRLEKFFGRKSPSPIRVFMFPSRKSAEPYKVGTASPALRAYYGLYQKGYWQYEKHHPGHELTHIFTNTDKRWRTMHVIGLLDEGLAEYFSGFHMDAHDRLTQHMLVAGRRNMYLRIRANKLDYGKMGLHEYGGSFVKFLIESQPQGKRKILQLLLQTRLFRRGDKADFNQFKDVLSKVYGKSLLTLVQEWNQAIAHYWRKSYPIRTADQKALEQLVKRKSLGAIQRIFYFRFKWYLQLVVWLPNRRWAVARTNAKDEWVIPRRPMRRL